MFSSRIITGDALSVLRRGKEGSVQCCVTSPPYFGLRDYGTKAVLWPEMDYAPMAGLPPVHVPAWEGELGQEPTLTMYVGHLVLIFRELSRCLRPDGTLWLNIGDSYASKPPGNKTVGVSASSTLNGVNGKSGSYRKRLSKGHQTKRDTSNCGLPTKNLLGVPWRVAFALQADGWYLRQDCIWSKPNPMVSSVEDRCTTAHEYLFLLTKSRRYFFDGVAIAEPTTDKESRRGYKRSKGDDRLVDGKKDEGYDGHRTRAGLKNLKMSGKVFETRIKRSVWTIVSRPFKGAHFATMPPKLAKLCIIAGTGEKGCCLNCRTPWRRVVEKTRVATRPGKDTKVTGNSKVEGNRDPLRHVTTSKTMKWEKACDCPTDETQPCLVLDPFSGSGTTCVVAKEMNRSYIGIEANPEYVKMSESRLGRTKVGFGFSIA